MWSVIQNQQCADADEVQIDNQANMKPLFIKVRFVKMSPKVYNLFEMHQQMQFYFYSVHLKWNSYFRAREEPANQMTLNKSNQYLPVLSSSLPWVRGTYLIPSLPPYTHPRTWTVSWTWIKCWVKIYSLSFLGIVSGQYPLEEGPLSQMSEAVNNIDKGEGGHGPHTPCTPHTPGMPATPHTPGTGHKSPRSGSGINR